MWPQFLVLCNENNISSHDIAKNQLEQKSIFDIKTEKRILIFDICLEQYTIIPYAITSATYVST